ncbi:Aste57867_13295 [Aphanomyces stellatus]|uniref:Aste57867_13295 protein n=1 Tax=Aphanomyces stellatus TaxID=120398 RepID=A0A485KY28_9STRA|nr:hypothetical protein As57867_013246 [Aphanomyces stellatus]VFT90134.1 Aste57867_13295 [Aphanomyces stellatus]
MLMDVGATQDDTNATRLRQAARLRMRRLRAHEKDESARLQSTLVQLQSHLARLHAAGRHRGESEQAAIAFIKRKALREQVASQVKLVELLSAWVASQGPATQSRVSSECSSSSWLHATLPAHPAARHEGFEWLSKRVYHAAIRMCQTSLSARSPLHVVKRVDEAHSFNVHTCEMDDDGTSIAGTESHVQSIFFAHFKLVARAVWKLYGLTSNSVVSSLEVWTGRCGNIFLFWQQKGLLPPLVFVGTTHFSGKYHDTGVTLRRILRLFEDADRVVIVMTLVAEDDCFPLAPEDIRTRGCGWTIMERVTDSITVVRHSVLSMAPLTTHGVAALDEIGRAYGQGRAGVEHRRAYIERICNVASTKSHAEYQQVTALIRHFLQESSI